MHVKITMWLNSLANKNYYIYILIDADKVKYNNKNNSDATNINMSATYIE